MTLTDSDGNVKEVELTIAGDVFGKPTGKGKTRTVSLQRDGFQGSYNPPAAIQAAADETEKQKRIKE